jgi:hypothetical protein
MLMITSQFFILITEFTTTNAVHENIEEGEKATCLASFQLKNCSKNNRLAQ